MPDSCQVFLSSTWQDLQAERAAVESAILRMRDTEFAGMEYFGSRAETPRDVSLQEVDACNLYVGIFARRYGSGITEDEYRRAVARGVPVLIYLKDDSVVVPPEFVESDAVKAAQLDALLRELKSKHTVSFFKNPDQLATLVVADLHSQMGRMQMDVSELVKQLTPILIPLLPYLGKLGDGVVDGAGELMAAGTWERVKSLWAKLKPKVDAKPAAQEAVQDVARNPQDEDAQAALRQQLKKILSEDETLASQVAEWLKENAPRGNTVIASGERSVAIGGSVRGSTINTGDTRG
jgi:hypothetical protein